MLDLVYRSDKVRPMPAKPAPGGNMRDKLHVPLEIDAKVVIVDFARALALAGLQLRSTPRGLRIEPASKLPASVLAIIAAMT